jgi:hypothetical protein
MSDDTKKESSPLFFIRAPKQENEELIDVQQVLSQNIWLTPFIKISGDMCMTKICCENGVF